MYTEVQEAVKYIRSKISTSPEIALVLGSGFGNFAYEMKQVVSIAYKDIPHFFVGSVPGHANELLAGVIAKKNILCMKGRIHYYEAGVMEKVIFPIRVLHALGIKTIIFTNAAGAINPAFNPGDLIVIRDHINCLGTNPLIGKHEDAFGSRFTDLTDTYDQALRTQLKEVFGHSDIPYKEGVYVAVTGPSYETPAEIRMFKTMGADLVGMSTVPSVIVARQGGIKVVAVSCITNTAAGISPAKISHEEVIATGKQAQEKFKNVLIEFIKRL